MAIGGGFYVANDRGSGHRCAVPGRIGQSRHEAIARNGGQRERNQSGRQHERRRIEPEHGRHTGDCDQDARERHADQVSDVLGPHVQAVDALERGARSRDLGRERYAR